MPPVCVPSTPTHTYLFLSLQVSSILIAIHTHTHTHSINLTSYPVPLGLPLPVWLVLEAALSITHNGLTSLSAPPQGRVSARQWPAPLFRTVCRLPCFLPGARDSAVLPSPWNARRLAFRSPSASFPPPSHPHPQPHPTSLVLSHHGDRISKWEGLESPHILPPPLLSHCAPLLWLLDSHLWRQDPRCGKGRGIL